MSSQNEKILIVPDIHNACDKADKIINLEKSDKVVFLGDYFDNYYDGPAIAEKTAKWLVNSLKIENRVHLIGNHDLSYMSNNPNFRCSGYTEEKHNVIKQQEIPWHKLKMHYWLDEKWLCTHAGLSNSFFEWYNHRKKYSIQRFLDTSQKNLDNIEDMEYDHNFFKVSWRRGGSGNLAGTLWCDHEEFEPILGINQIYGHTNGSVVRKNENSENYCIDTALNNYAVYQNHAIEIKTTPKD